MENCIFCKIITKEIPANIIYEDKNFLAFMDIHPVQKGHVLVIPKIHVPWIQDLSDELTMENALVIKKLIPAIIGALNCDYIHCVVEGVEVAHAHTHLIPSMIPVKNAQWNHASYADGEIEIYSTKIGKFV